MSDFHPTEFKQGDTVQADGHLSLHRGQTAKVRSVSRVNAASPQIIDLIVADANGQPDLMIDLVCYNNLPLIKVG